MSRSPSTISPSPSVSPSVYDISHADGVVRAIAVNAARLLEVVVQLTVLRRPRPTPPPTVAPLPPALKNQRQDLQENHYDTGLWTSCEF